MANHTLQDTTSFRHNLITLHPPLFFNTLLLLALGVWVGVGWPASAAAQGESDARPLKIGAPVERELAGGQSHTYQITLAAGQFLRVVVEQRGVDVAVRLLGPDDKTLWEVDGEGKQGKETVSYVAEAAGDYRLRVLAARKDAPVGRYEIRVTELRAATAQDRALQEAHEVSQEFAKLYTAGKYDEARPRAERAVTLREQALGPDHPEVAAALNNLALLCYQKGDFAQAERLLERTAAIWEKASGPEHPAVAQALNNLAALHRARGDYVRAEPLYHRALAIAEKAFGPEHPRVAAALNNLAGLYRAKGDYNRAEPYYQRALMILEKRFGPEHADVATALHNLGNLHQTRGDYTRAEPLYGRALAVWEKTLGPAHPDVALALNNLAVCYQAKGDYAQAERLYQRALPIREKTFGPEHPEVAQSLHNLAELHRTRGDYAPAEPLQQRALAIREKALGAAHPDVAQSLNSLASLYSGQSDYARAEPLLARALAIWEKTFGPEHPEVALALNNLASLHHARGDYAQSEQLHQRALAIREKTLGPEHPLVATSLNNLATLYVAQGDLTQAVAMQARASAVSERNLALNLAAGSERQKLAYLATLAIETDRVVSLHVRAAPQTAMARRLALTAILQRKGRALDAMFDGLGALRRRFDAQDQTLLDQWQEASAQLARLVLAGPQRMTPTAYRQRIAALTEEREKLEGGISRRSAEFRVQAQPVTIEAVQAAIPEQAALVEFFSYRPFNPKYTRPEEVLGPPHYVAYVLRRQGEPQWVGLGAAQAIDEAVAAWRAALRDPQRADVKRLARQVDERVLRPVRALLGETRRVFIAPDGMLNLIPFAALVDEDDRYQVKRYSFSYLTSGRDLLRAQARPPDQAAPVIVADPAFDAQAGAIPALRREVVLQPNSPSAAAGGLGQAYFPPLSGTAREARALKALLPQATLLTREQATEAALKRLNSPRLLHVATHGFFLTDRAPGPAGLRDVILTANGVTTAAPGLSLENPLLRSGLALAGANQRQGSAGQEDDGVLTALEVAGLDLWGTKLVVLSACDTGVGAVTTGEGVFGLRRALVLAGAQTQVMSLWPVSDEGTRDLMIAYYKGLQRGAGRGEALRQVQLEMLKDKTRRHPFYWASFIQSGEWGSLEGER